MENLLAGLALMFFDLVTVTKSNNGNPVLVFSVSCAVVGAFAVILDCAFYFLRGRSLLDLKHGKQTFGFLFAWSFGAFIIGWIGQMTSIFVVSVSASVLVGFTWPLIITKYLKNKADEENADEPEQALEEEE